jgi:hypothetical protein
MFFNDRKLTAETEVAGMQEKIHQKKTTHVELNSVLKFLNNPWGLGTEYSNRVIVPARQAT